MMHRKHIRFITPVTLTIDTLLSTTFLMKKLQYRLQLERCSYLFVYLKVQI